jgi:hypothetical protein
VAAVTAATVGRSAGDTPASTVLYTLDPSGIFDTYVFPADTSRCPPLQDVMRPFVSKI